MRLGSLTAAACPRRPAILLTGDERAARDRSSPAFENGLARLVRRAGPISFIPGSFNLVGRVAVYHSMRVRVVLPEQ